ncbi:MAG: CcmD family protein [Salinibacter sp.]
MTIHPLRPSDAPTLRPAQERPDTTSAYDSTWAEQPTEQSRQPSGLDRIMGQNGKIYVVLAVILLIWFGLLTVLFRTDRKIDRLERRLDRHISDNE